MKRPSTRPFAAYSGHDPDGNVFDLAQKKNDTRLDLYAQQANGSGTHERYINKFAIRTPNAEQCAEFYADVFELQPVNRKTDAPGYHLTDGRITLSDHAVVDPGVRRTCRSSAPAPIISASMSRISTPSRSTSPKSAA